MKRIISILAVIAIFGLLIYLAANFLFFSKKQGDKKAIKTIVMRRDIEQVVRGSGIIISHEQVEIATKLPGTFNGFAAKVGEIVETDQVLFSIENTDVENEYNLANAEFKKAKVELQKLKDQPDPARMLEAENALSKAKVAYDEAQKGLELKKKLFGEGFVSQKEYDDLAHKLDFAENENDLAQSRYDEVAKPASAEEVGLAQAKLNKLEIQLDTIKEKMDGRTVTSPITGTIVDVKIDESLLERDEEIPAGTAVMTIANLKENLFVNGEIYESDVHNIKVGQNALIYFSQQEEPSKGKITEISLVAKAYGTVRKFPMEIEIIDDVSQFVKLGSRIDFQAVIAEKKQVLSIPLTFVHSLHSGKGVILLQGEYYRMVPVKTGIYNDQVIEIVSGLEERQEVYLNTPENQGQRQAASSKKSQKMRPSSRSAVRKMKR